MLLIGLVLLSLIASSNKAVAESSLCAEAQVDIAQELTLERQAFEAHLRINNGMANISLEDVVVEVEFTDEDGQVVQASSNASDSDPDVKFFIRLSSTEHVENLHIETDKLSFSGSINPSTSADIYWRIIPVPGASDGIPDGKMYYVGATLGYTMGGEAHVTAVSPDYIFVRPMPDMFLDYFLPLDVYGDDPDTPAIESSEDFSLGLRVSNQGSGPAYHLAIESARPEITRNEQDLLYALTISGSEVNGEAATPSVFVEFGDLVPNTASVARWTMSSSLSGEFKDFRAEFSHADELGGTLTSLLKAEQIRTHLLVRDVLVDLPGRDAVRDFLSTSRANPGAEYTVYESQCLSASACDAPDLMQVQDLSESPQTRLEGASSPYTLTLPETSGCVYVNLPAPGAGPQIVTSVTRSDGKQIQPANAWMSKTRNADNEWQYFLNLFDAILTPQAFTYTIHVADASGGPQPPVLQSIPEQDGRVGEQLAFLVQASDPDGTIPQLSAAPLPAGAVFIDQGDGSAIFDWTPGDGQAGTYTLTCEASDGDLRAARAVDQSVFRLYDQRQRRKGGEHYAVRRHSGPCRRQPGIDDHAPIRL